MGCAARYSAVDCLQLLLKHSDKLDWSAQKRPLMLAEAVKHQNLDIIELMMAKMEALQISFVCDDVMSLVIKYDLVDIAKRIVNNRWHKINEKDEALAKSINLGCHEYFSERARAFNFNNDDEEDDFDDDDDWQNAVDTPREEQNSAQFEETTAEEELKTEQVDEDPN